ncbi:MAG: heavy metal translocating P-type ATPase, partial [Flavobacteriaceae bacterium]|nr:heavy metal translocating P-type ATPase [Flavobacteriaceae bacterium]
MMTQTYYVSGMTCDGCKKHVTHILTSIIEADSISVSLEEQTAQIIVDKKLNFKKIKSNFEEESHGAYRLFSSKEALENSINETQQTQNPEANTYFCPMRCEGDKTYDKPGDCPVCGMDLVPLNKDDKTEANQWLRRLWVSAGFSAVIFILAMGSMLFPHSFKDFLPNFYNQLLQAALSIPVLFFSGRFIFTRGWKSFKTWKLNMFSLISIGVASAWIFSIVALFLPEFFPKNFKTQTGEVHIYFETAVIIVALVILGQYLEHKAYGKTQASIRELLELQPSTALLITDDGVKEVPAEQIELGDRLKLRPGDKVPVDAKIVEGTGILDESMITGESVSEEKQAGDEVFAGTILNDGSLILEALKVGKDTVLSKIIDLVSEAMSSKAPLQKFADKVAAYFVPAVIVISVITYFVWAFFGPDPGQIYGLINAVAVLIIACPCALGLATPISITVGIGKGAQNGILIKNAKAIDQLSKIQHLILDKTGTLTEGKPVVADIRIHSNKYHQKQIHQLLYGIAGKSSHPLSKSILKHFDQEQFSEVNLEDFKNISGKGLSASFEGKKILFGNRQLLASNQIDLANVNPEAENTESLLA